MMQNWNTSPMWTHKSCTAFHKVFLWKAQNNKDLLNIIQALKVMVWLEVTLSATVQLMEMLLTSNVCLCPVFVSIFFSSCAVLLVSRSVSSRLPLTFLPLNRQHNPGPGTPRDPAGRDAQRTVVATFIIHILTWCKEVALHEVLLWTWTRSWIFPFNSSNVFNMSQQIFQGFNGWKKILITLIIIITILMQFDIFVCISFGYCRHLETVKC